MNPSARKTAVATLLGLALAAPAATARPLIDPPHNPPPEPAPAPPHHAAGEGFDWAAAGIGGGLVLVAAGGLAARRDRVAS
jgi:hypothetical protein